MRKGNVADDIEFEDIESIPSQSGGGFKQIALDQFRKCCNEGSKEMTLGGVMLRYVQGQAVEMSVPNQVEIYINSVEMLRILLQPKLTKETAISKNIDKHYDELVSAAKERDNNKMIISQDFTKRPDDWQKKHAEQFNGKLLAEDRAFESFQILKLRKILEQLSILLDKLKYFEEGKVSA